MMKRILISIALLVIIAYLAAAVTVFNQRPTGEVCKAIELVVKDSVYAGFVTQHEVESLLKKKGISPVGKELERVRTETIEDVLAKHPLIDRVECYKTPDSKVCIEVSQRVPVLRVMNDKGETYYVDNKGLIMPREAKCVAHVPVATGCIDRHMATNELYRFARYLQNNPFWDAQIEQIHVLTDRNVELATRVGNHLVYLGKLTDYERKLDRLQTFYRKGLNKVGWNKYSRINVEFDNQIICTKR